VIARAQLIEIGLSPEAIRHRLGGGRLHTVWRGVYAVGSPLLTQQGFWMAAVLGCGPDAVLSHHSAAALWGFGRASGGGRRRQVGATRAGEHVAAARAGVVHVTVARGGARGRRGIRVHRPPSLPAADRTLRERIPVTSPARTLIDLATCVDRDDLESAVNEADILELVDPNRLRAIVDDRAGVRGAAALRALLDRRTFAMTRSQLERWFIPIARRAGLPRPQTCVYVNGYEVDFYWPDLGLVVESDGLRYHRTPAEQARDRVRDQAHARAGLTPLRFTHWQVRYERGYVLETLVAVAGRLSHAAA
jgi:very-short-patch-repair endonuclease